MKSITSFLAWRYLTFQRKDKNISFMIKICFLGIFIGTFSLMLTLIITNGFEKTIHEKMQGINAQIIINAPGNQLQYDPIKKVIHDEFGTNIKGISSNTTKQAILEIDKQHSVIFLKGIDHYNEHLVTNLHTKITYPKNVESLSMLEQENSIIIGHAIAQQNALSVGDLLTVLIPEPSGRKKIALSKKVLTITGIFKVGLDEYDSNIAFCSHELIDNLYDQEGVDQITITLKQSRTPLFFGQPAEVTLIKNLKQRFPSLRVHSWKDYYPALVSSLKLEKYVSFFILALITLVASLNMISLLFMQIQHKRKDIAILKAMGLSHSKIQNIFLRVGMSITLLASTLGLSLAALSGYLLNKYPFIKLPDVYYISHLPARLDWEIFVVVFLATILLGFIATWIPARQVKSINVADVLRQE